MLLLVASALHLDGRLPPRSWFAPMLLALALLVLAGLGAAWLSKPSRSGPIPAIPARPRWRRCLPAVIAVSPWGSALLLACMLVHGQVHEALASRLSPHLEGLDLEVVGVVDGMPQRFEFGDRVRFSLHGLLGGAQLGGDAGALAHIPAPSGHEQAGTGS